MPPYEKDPLFVPSDIYVARICELFDYWMKDKDCNIGLSYFEHYMNYLFLQEKHLCSFNSRMGKFTGIRYDGSICACNRDFPKQYSFGNVYDYTYIRECFSSDGYKAMLNNAIKRRDECHLKCSIYDFCTGGCNHVALIGGDISKQNSYFCNTRLPIYQHIQEKVKP